MGRFVARTTVLGKVAFELLVQLLDNRLVGHIDAAKQVVSDMNTVRGLPTIYADIAFAIEKAGNVLEIKRQ